MRVETIGDCVLYNADCRVVLPTLGKVDAVVTDPPYGINADKGAGKSSDKWTAFSEGKRWDSERADDETLARIIAQAEHAIVWGGNYFGLPPTPCWLIWDKETAGITSFADCEVAWTNLGHAMRLKRHLWSGPYMKVRETRYHPTQKPLAVMEWCLEQIPKAAKSVLDPYCGSGTTGVAAVRRMMAFTGIESDERYFDIACRRIEEAYRQADLFIAPPSPEPERQGSLLDEAAA